jgi:hypothetical protein
MIDGLVVVGKLSVQCMGLWLEQVHRGCVLVEVRSVALGLAEDGGARHGLVVCDGARESLLVEGMNGAQQEVGSGDGELECGELQLYALVSPRGLQRCQ